MALPLMSWAMWCDYDDKDGGMDLRPNPDVLNTQIMLALEFMIMSKRSPEIETTLEAILARTVQIHGGPLAEGGEPIDLARVDRGLRMLESRRCIAIHRAGETFRLSLRNAPEDRGRLAYDV